MFLFGLDAAEVERSAGWYDPRWHLDHQPRVRSAVDFMLGEHFAWKDPGVFERLGQALIAEGDRWRLLADLESYLTAQEAASDRYGDAESWWRSAIRCTARGGRFSSDRAIREYAEQIWHVGPVPLDPTAGGDPLGR